MEKHHSCLNTRAIIEYFQENQPGEVYRLFSGLGPEIEDLANPQEFLMEINNWVSSDVVTKMFDNAKAITQDDEIPFKIGFESAARKKLGYVQRIIMFAHKNPRRTLRRVQAINDKFNKNKIIELVSAKGDRATIRLHWFKEIPGTIDYCLFNKGIYTGIPTIWNLPPATLEETKCYFQGDEYCEYHFRWERKFSIKEVMLRLLVPWRALNYTIEELERDKELLKKKFDEIHRLNIQLKEKIDQLICMQETSTAALSVLNLEKLLQVTLRLLINSAKLDRAGILLLDEKGELLELTYAEGISPELLEGVKNYRIPITKVDNVIARVAMTGIPVVIQNVARSKLNMNNPLIQFFKPKAFILAPLTVRGKVIGVLMADRVHEEATITDGDREFIVSFANQIAIALENAVLYRKIEVSERKYRELVENAHEGIWIIDEKGSIKFANRRMREITGHDTLENRHIYDLVDQYNQKLLKGVMTQNRMNKVAQEELDIICQNRGLASVIMSSVPLFEDDHFVGAFAMFSDVTVLRETEKRFRKIFEEAAIGMCLVDMEGRLLDVNPAILNMLGFTKDEMYRKPIQELLHAGDVKASTGLFKELGLGKRDSFSRENRYRHKDGRVVWGQVTMSLLRGTSGIPQFAIAMIADITDRKQAEEDIRTYQEQLQSLASELSLTEERERRRLATDLHDHIGQALAVSKIKLGVLQKTVNIGDHAKPIGEVRELIEQMIKDTRSLTFELSLPVLYELGFEAAVEWFAKHVRSQHGIKVDVQQDLMPIPMDDEIKVLLFRSVRELMMNIVKHAQARNARVTIRRDGDGVNIEVEDDGVGMGDVKRDSKLKGNGGFGLFSIRERLHYLGGQVQMESEKGRGTRITLMVPLRHAKKAQAGIV
ncbi:MAG: PAS domain S-box protein [Syntrophobacterales bacterium]|jgi:PAS domain S-box-containing protein|nr:PAS domain S-box protein [Syntrophobacterales bacterium]